MASIIIADDHLIVRQGLKLLLEMEKDFQVIGEAKDGVEALELLRRRRPDLLLLDYVMPRLSGADVLRRVRQMLNPPRVLVLSMNEDESSVAEALELGAHGYVLKSVGAAELTRAIRQVLIRSARDDAKESRNRKTKRPASRDGLTGRERTILQLYANGLTAGHIARQLFISPRTVETHRANLMHKLNLHSQTDVVRYAIRHKMIRA